MKRILIIVAGDRKKPSSRVRGYSVAEYLNSLHDDETVRVNTLHGENLEQDMVWCEVVVFQKLCNRSAYSLFGRAKKQGKKVYYDIDDGLFLYINNGNVRFDHMLRWYPFVLPMIRQADGVIAGGHYLYQFCKRLNKRVRWIPSSISLQHYRPASDLSDKQLTVGWIGQGNVHKKDLLRLAPVFTMLSRNYNFKLSLIGTVDEADIKHAYQSVKDITCIDQLNWAEEAEMVRVIQSFDIGLMPLANTAWNRYKCGYKLIQYMGCAVVPVCSSVGENGFIVADGWDGFLVDDEKEWENVLREIFDLYYQDRVAFNAMRERAADKAAGLYSYEVNMPVLNRFLSS